MELVQKLELFASKIDQLLERLEQAENKNLELEANVLNLSERNRMLLEERDLIKSRIEKLVSKLG